MNFEPAQELIQFAFRFLENHGAVLERNGHGFEALLPDELSRLLGTGEHIRIKEESGAGFEGAYSINYGSPLLEKMADAACARVPLLACRLEFDYLKSQGFDRLVKEGFSFNRSVGKVERWARIKTCYLLLTCRYTAQSDEQTEGLITLAINSETGAVVPRMKEMLSMADRDFDGEAKQSVGTAKQIDTIIQRVKEQSKEIIFEKIGPFRQSMNRRFRRDVVNLEEYYQALEREMKKSLGRPGLSEELISNRKEKIALLPDELARKKDDLFKKYSIKVRIEPCAAVLIITPAIKILYKISIGKNHRNLSLIYNPVTKSIDPVVCQGCGTSITSGYFCDYLHLLCTLCHKKCPVCQGLGQK